MKDPGNEVGFCGRVTTSRVLYLHLKGIFKFLSILKSKAVQTNTDFLLFQQNKRLAGFLGMNHVLFVNRRRANARNVISFRISLW